MRSQNVYTIKSTVQSNELNVRLVKNDFPMRFSVDQQDNYNSVV